MIENVISFIESDVHHGNITGLCHRLFQADASMNMRTSDIPASHRQRSGTIIRFIACQDTAFQSRRYSKRFVSRSRFIGVTDDRITPELIKSVINGHLIFIGFFFVGFFRIIFLCAGFFRAVFSGVSGIFRTAFFLFLFLRISFHLINFFLRIKLQKTFFVHRIIQIIGIGGRHAEHLAVPRIHDENTCGLAAHLFIKIFQFFLNNLLYLHINGADH